MGRLSESKSRSLRKRRRSRPFSTFPRFSHLLIVQIVNCGGSTFPMHLGVLRRSKGCRTEERYGLLFQVRRCLYMDRCRPEIRLYYPPCFRCSVYPLPPLLSASTLCIYTLFFFIDQSLHESFFSYNRCTDYRSTIDVLRRLLAYLQRHINGESNALLKKTILD